MSSLSSEDDGGGGGASEYEGDGAGDEEAAFLARAGQRLAFIKKDLTSATSIHAKGDVGVLGLQLILAMQALDTVSRMAEMRTPVRAASVSAATTQP